MSDYTTQDSSGSSYDVYDSEWDDLIGDKWSYQVIEGEDDVDATLAANGYSLAPSYYENSNEGYTSATGIPTTFAQSYTEYEATPKTYKNTGAVAKYVPSGSYSTYTLSSADAAEMGAPGSSSSKDTPWYSDYQSSNQVDTSGKAKSSSSSSGDTSSQTTLQTLFGSSSSSLAIPTTSKSYSL